MSALYKPRPERWPQFTLRGFFVLVAVVGVGLWMFVHLAWIRDRHAALAGLQARYRQGRGLSRWRYAIDRAANLPWGLRVFGEPSVEVIELTTTPNEHRTRIARLKQLFPEAEMNEVVNWKGNSAGSTITLDGNEYTEEDRRHVQGLYPGSTVVRTTP